MSDRRWLAAPALAALLVAASSEWLWSAAYFGTATFAGAAALMLVNAVLVMVLADFILARTNRRGVLALTLLIWALLRAFTGLLAPQIGLASAGPRWQWLLLLALGVGAWVSARRFGPAPTGRLAFATLVGAALFVAATPLKGLVLSLAPAPAFGLSWLPPEANYTNVLIVLFDEMSPEVTGPVVEALAQAGTVRSEVIASAGANTINVVPAMLTGRRFDLPGGEVWMTARASREHLTKSKMVD